MNANDNQDPQHTGPRVVHAPTPGVDWDALEYLDCYLITEEPQAAQCNGNVPSRRLSVEANRRQVGTASTFAEARDMIIRHFAESLIFVEEDGGIGRIWAVAVADQSES